MATDISKTQTGVIAVTEGTARPKVFVGRDISYSFNTAGTTLNLNFGGTSTYSIAFADLTVQTVAPADVAAAYTALATAFKIV